MHIIYAAQQQHAMGIPDFRMAEIQLSVLNERILCCTLFNGKCNLVERRVHRFRRGVDSIASRMIKAQVVLQLVSVYLPAFHFVSSVTLSLCLNFEYFPAMARFRGRDGHVWGQISWMNS
jgi:hypothetical protein